MTLLNFWPCFINQHFNFSTSEDFAFSSTHLYHKDERALPGNLHSLKFISVFPVKFSVALLSLLGLKALMSVFIRQWSVARIGLLPHAASNVMCVESWCLCHLYSVLMSERCVAGRRYEIPRYQGVGWLKPAVSLPHNIVIPCIHVEKRLKSSGTFFDELLL
jgi:hypothetical protein